MRRFLSAVTLAVLTVVLGCGGGGGSNPLGLSRVAAEIDKVGKATVPTTGGTITATGSNGVVYTLVIPNGGLTEPTEISLYPVSNISGAPFSGGIVAGFHMTPEGLQLAKAATMTVHLPAGVSTAGLKGFGYAKDAEELHLYPMTAAGSDLTFQIVHFSGGGAGGGSYSGAAPTTAQAVAENSLAILLNGQTPPTANQLADVLLTWYNATVKPGLTNAATAVNPLPILDEYRAWTLRATGLGSDVALILAPQLGEADTKAVAAMKAIINQTNQTCSINGAKLALRVAKRARAWGLGTTANGLEFQSILNSLCVQVKFERVDFPTDLQAGGTGTLSLKVGYTMNGGATRYDQPMAVTATPSGGSPLQLTPNASGETSATATWPSGAEEFRIDVHATFADLALRDIYQDAFIVRHDSTQTVNLPTGTWSGDLPWQFSGPGAPQIRFTCLTVTSSLNGVSAIKLGQACDGDLVYWNLTTTEVRRVNTGAIEFIADGSGVGGSIHLTGSITGTGPMNVNFGTVELHAQGALPAGSN